MSLPTSLVFCPPCAAQARSGRLQRGSRGERGGKLGTKIAVEVKTYTANDDNNHNTNNKNTYSIVNIGIRCVIVICVYFDYS